MNIPSKMDILHGFYKKTKNAFLIVFSFSIIFLSLISHSAYGESVVGTVNTKLNVKIDGKTLKINTTQNNVGAALKQNNIVLEKNDIAEPSIETYLSGKNTSVKITRSLPVLITDNSQSWAAKSAYSQPADILKQLEVVVYPEDKISVDLILDPAAVGLVGQNVIINRAPVYTIHVDDETKLVRSWAKNVGDMLAEKGISLGANDLVEPPLGSSLADITDIGITRINFADTEETVAVPFQTIEQNDYNLYQGKSLVKQNGINGSKKQSLHIVYKNGVEVDRTITSSETLQTVQNKIISVGVKPYGMDDLWPILVAAGSKYGIDPLKMSRVMICESGGKQYSGQYGRYQGLFQWDKNSTLYSTYAAKAGYSGASIFDVHGQIYATAQRVSDSGGSWAAWGQCQNR